MDGLDYSQQRDSGSLKVTPISLSEGGEHVYAAKYSPEGEYLAVTFANGVVRVLNTTTYASLHRGRLGPGFDDLPSTAVKWRPRSTNLDASGDEADFHTQMLATVSAAGGVFGFAIDSTPGSVAFDRVWKCPEQGNDTAALDFSPGGEILATAGQDRTVRLYDMNTRQLKESLTRGVDDAGHHRPAHTNRIFCVRFLTPQTLLTAGWENPIQIWDLRTGCAARTIAGPQVCSDSVEVVASQGKILVANNRNTRQIQVFDYVSCREIVQEGDKLSRSIGGSHLSQVRVAHGLLWAIASKPDRLLCIDAATGDLRGSVDDFGHLLLCAEASDATPGRCVVGGFKQNLYVVDAQL